MINKKELARRVSSQRRSYLSVAEAIIDCAFTEITHAVGNGETVKIAGFGTFMPMKRAPRVGNVPSRGERVEIPAKTAMVFKPCLEVKQYVMERNNGNGQS